MRPLHALLITASIILPAAACDDSPTVEHILAAEVDRLQAENDALRASLRQLLPIVMVPEDGAVSFREAGKPWQKYLPALETQDTVAAIMNACGVKPITVSTSGYDPDITTSDAQVLSLGYSYMGNAAERKCLDDEMDKRGALSI